MRTILMACAFLGTAVAADAAECKRYAGPSRDFENPAGAWNATDTGIVAKGFVDLAADGSNGSGEFFDVEHGPDLSVYDEVDVGRIKECGGTFAFARLDDAYARHVDSLAAANIVSIPYFYFGMGAALRGNSQYESHTETNKILIKTYMDRFEKVAKDAAARFGSLIGNNLKTVEFAGLSGKIVSVDIEEKLKYDELSTPKQRVYYGRYYAHAACTWIREVQRQYPGAIVLLYTTPSVYADYLQYAYPDDNACLQAALIWIARTTVDGGDALRSDPGRINLMTQRLCIVSGGNRCIIHQYSHRATFASIGPSNGSIPPHMDVNRFFKTKRVKTDSGEQFVRSDEKKSLDASKFAVPP